MLHDPVLSVALDGPAVKLADSDAIGQFSKPTTIVHSLLEVLLLPKCQLMATT